MVDNLLGVHDPDYFSAFFRKTNTELETNLWPEAKKMYWPLLFEDQEGKRPIGKSHISEKDKVITFPSGAKSKFSYMQYEKDANAWYGSELAKIYIDELQFHSEHTFDVLRSRNRSRAKVPKGMRFTLNPDCFHWMYDWIKPFLDEETGMPIEEIGGKVRYYVIIEGMLHTDWDKQKLKDNYGIDPQTYTYVPAKLEDNKILQELDPEYFSVLNSMPTAKRNQLLLGCWLPVEEKGMYFERDKFQKASSVPVGSKTIRAWDLARKGVEDGKDVNRNADWTVGIKMSKCPQGNIYIHGMERFQLKSAPRDNRIVHTGYADGRDCHLVLSVDAGPAGDFQHKELVKFFTSKSLICKKDPMRVTKTKLQKAEPYITGVQSGLVYIVESSFTPEQKKQFYNEHEKFDGERSRSDQGKWDDIVDACGSGYNYLMSSRNHKITKRNQQSHRTTAAERLERI